MDSRRIATAQHTFQLMMDLTSKRYCMNNVGHLTPELPCLNSQGARAMDGWILKNNNENDR